MSLSKVACVRRKSCQLKRRRPALAQAGCKTRLSRFPGRKQVPAHDWRTGSESFEVALRLLTAKGFLQHTTKRYVSGPTLSSRNATDRSRTSLRPSVSATRGRPAVRPRDAALGPNPYAGPKLRHRTIANLSNPRGLGSSSLVPASTSSTLSH